MKKIFVLTRLVLENNNCKDMYAQAVAVAYDFEEIVRLAKEEIQEIIEENFEDDINEGLTVEQILDKLEDDEYDGISCYFCQYGNSFEFDIDLEKVSYKLSVDRLEI